MNVRHRYGLLRFIAGAIRVLGWLVLILAIALAIIVLTGVGIGDLSAAARSAGTGVTLLVGIVWWVQLIAFGSVLSLLIDIEENTRALAAQPPE